MKRYLLALILSAVGITTVCGQQTLRYMSSGCYDPYGNFTPAVGCVTVDVEYGNNYINILDNTLYCSGYNRNGLAVYPTPQFHYVLGKGVLVNSNRSTIQIVQQNTFLPGCPEVLFVYNYVATVSDGSSSIAPDYSGNSGYTASPAPVYVPNAPSYSRGSSSTREWHDCISCYGSGNFQTCNGSGKYWNGVKTDRCGVCYGSGDCSGCGGKRGYWL